jgi:predicted nucleic acid binding AN1-type Zn finger protein
VHDFSKIIYRKISASLLLALLIFVYTEKAFHTHANVANSTATGITSTSNTPGCDICDFTIAKDAELPGFTDINATSSFLVKKYIPVSSPWYYHSCNFISGRGPPSL